MQYLKLKGGSLCCEGIPYITVCDKAIGQGSAEAKRVAQCIRDVIQNNKKNFNTKYPCYSHGDKRWFEVKISAFQQKSDICYIVTHMPITETIYNLK